MPLLQIGSGDEGGQERDAAPSHRGVAQHLGIVGAQRPRNVNPVLAVGPGELPLITGGEVAVGETIVAAQIIGMLRRATGA